MIRSFGITVIINSDDVCTFNLIILLLSSNDYKKNRFLKIS